MSKNTTHGATGSPLMKLGSFLTPGKVSDDLRQEFLVGGRQADTFYRHRWSHDKVVRSTHGVNCTGSCSWKVYVKDGVITWEEQQTDYPTVGPDSPEYEPRGCPRGAAFSWYTYSPTRVRYPYIRSILLELYREAKLTHPDPVDAWESIVEDPAKASQYKQARGRGGLIRASWDEVTEIMGAAHVYTIKRYGPDRLAGFTVIPAMSMISYAAGSRFYSILGGVVLSFYDWYADLPMASPQVFGDQTDVPESADWYNAAYMIMWGSNIPLTRTPDAHFMTEARYRGQKVIAVSPDYADNTKFADEWLTVHPGTDGALALAMGHVILKEFYVDNQTPRFIDYASRYTDAPFLVHLEPRDGAYVPGKFVTAADFATDPDLAPIAQAEKPEFRPVIMGTDGLPKVPNGTLGDRFTESGMGKWNLDLEGLEPVLSAAELDVASPRRGNPVEVLLPRFDIVPGGEDEVGSHLGGAGVYTRGVPTAVVGGKLVTTVHDLMLAHYGVAREGMPGSWPANYEDGSQLGTPAWQEEITGVPANAAIRVAREFADTANRSQGRSMIVMGAGTNHWFHSDTIYRTFLALTNMTATQGVNGGGWAHYVGQEKVRPITGWAQYAFALDWQRPTRQMISTAFWYTNTSQWRYDGIPAQSMASPLSKGQMEGRTITDTLVESTKKGWMPSYPTFNRNTLDITDDAEAAGKEVPRHIIDELASGNLKYAVEDPEDPANFPRIITTWRTNLLGSSSKGNEYFLRHLLGTSSSVRSSELEPEHRPRDVHWREKAGEGKVDLFTTADFRMTSTTLYSDIVLPAATWYEKHDLSSTDMHPYVHTFNAAIQPPWESRTDFQLFQDLAGEVSKLSEGHLGVRRDVIAAPLNHDTPDELATPRGQVSELDELAPTPGVNMPKLIVIERDYTATLEKFNGLGPLTQKLGMVTKGVAFDPTPEVEMLGRANGVVKEGLAAGRASLDTDLKAAQMVLMLSGTTNGRLATTGFKMQEKRTGHQMHDLALEQEGKIIRLEDVQARPTPVITSPEWSGSETGGRRYTAFAINVERLKPWHTLTGRMQYYLDHDWMSEYGESLPVYRPPLDLHNLFGDHVPGQTVTGAADVPGGGTQVAVRYLTPHSKWSIHSEYQDNIYMLSLFRGGPVMWMSPQDAEKIGVKDNEWIESYNRNGIVVARAAVTHRMPEGTVYVYHAMDRVVDVPKTEMNGLRGGIHNSLTRVLLKPTHLIGGYAQHSYAFNYIGPTGNQRDEITVIRRRSQEVEY